VRQALLARLLADWDPVRISAEMEARERDKALIGAWARAVQPRSEYIWQMPPQANLLGESNLGS
jgi:hypothetical protein